MHFLLHKKKLSSFFPLSPDFNASSIFWCTGICSLDTVWVLSIESNSIWIPIYLFLSPLWNFQFHQGSKHDHRRKSWDDKRRQVWSVKSREMNPSGFLGLPKEWGWSIIWRRGRVPLKLTVHL
jgi:hypothetical protein